MKSIFITLVFTLASCLNSSASKESDHIILPTDDVETGQQPDTFVMVDKNQLDPHVGSEVNDAPISEDLPQVEKETSKEELTEQVTSPIDSDTKSVNQSNSKVDASDNVVITRSETAKSVSDIELPTETKKTTDALAEPELVNEIKEESVTPSLVEEPKQEEKLTPIPEDEPLKQAIPDHSAFNKLLNSYVSSRGDVNYKAFKANEFELDAYLNDLDSNTPAAGWSANQSLAYWMNAYNAFTIKLILDNYPVNKITDLHGGKPWDQKWISLGGKTYSLNGIEHSIIRPTFNDPRIHFAVNCAAKSCPPLLNKAYTEANVDRELTKVTKAFVNSSANTISASSAQISKIFEWYGEDFGDLINFLNQYSIQKLSSDAKIGYLDYNWALNEG